MNEIKYDIFKKEEMNILGKLELTNDEKEFLDKHNAIVLSGIKASNSLYEFSIKLKEMKDSKAYLLGGFESFEDYSENVLHIKRRQAFNYIKIVERFGEFVGSSSLGIKKLTLLSSLDDDELKKIDNPVDKTVAQLTEEINQLRCINSDLEASMQLLQANGVEFEEQNKIIRDLQEELSLKPKEIVKEIPVEVIKEVVKPNPKDSEKLKKLNEKLSQYKSAFEELEAVKKELDEKDEYINRLNGQLNSIDFQSQEYDLVVAERDKLLKKLELLNDKNVMEFKIILELFNNAINRYVLFTNNISDNSFKEKCYVTIVNLLYNAKIIKKESN